jgi:hypothetical protein
MAGTEARAAATVSAAKPMVYLKRIVSLSF